MIDLVHKGMLNVKPAGKWDEAYPSGNGIQGVLVMGESLDETIIFNHERLFLPIPVNAATVLPDMSGELPEVRRLIREGKYREATRHFLDKAREKGFPSELLWPDPFHPAFELRIKTDDAGTAADYVRWLDFETGEAGVRWRGEKGTYERRVFVSRACDAVVIKLEAPSGDRLDCDIHLAEREGRRHIKSVSIRAGTFTGLISREPGPDCSAEKTHCGDRANPGDEMWLIFDSKYEVGDGGYFGVIRVHAEGGHVGHADGTVELRDTRGATIIARTIPCRDHISFCLPEAMAELAALPPDYGALLKEHAYIHGELFNRMRLELCGETDMPARGGKTAGADADTVCSNEELMEQAKNGVISPAFVEKMYDFGRYLLISSSGKLPPNLQGVWNGTWTPPWCSDYTLDENLQMMMWQVLPGNLPELAQSYFNLIESFIGDWKMNARLLYGCRGILSSPRSSTSGLTKHFCEDFPMMFWTAGAGWLAQMFYDYWQFTGDDAFLKDHTVPLLKEIALFYEDFLVEGPDGKYEFIPSYSPENTPSNSDNPVAINATMDIAVAKEVLSNLVSACEHLGIEAENIPKWKAMLDKMPDYLVNSDGALKEWSHPAFEDDYHHRHSSHLYPIFPGFEVTREGTPGLYRACLRAAELRLTDGLEAITGWGLAHLANISARLKDADLAFRALGRIMAKFLLPNLFTCHNVGELFQMDANLGFSAAILEMLVFSLPGYIELLPALPESLPKGVARGILCRGRITISELRWDMCARTISAVIRSETDQQVRLGLPGAIESFERDGVLQDSALFRNNAMLHGGASYPGGALLRVGVSPQDGGSSRNERSCTNIGSAGEDVRIAGQSSGGTADGPADASQVCISLRKGEETRLAFVLR